MKWRIFLRLLLSFAVLFLTIVSPRLSSAEDFPNRPITIVVNFAAGGLTDVVVRLMAPVAEKELGQPVIVANKPGGGGAVGLTELSRSKPDGYTIGTLTIGAMTVVPVLQKVAYSPFKSFDYISGVARNLYGIYARADSPFNSIKDVVQAARKDPGKITFGTMSPAIATGLRAVEAKEKIKLTFIPFRSGTLGVTNLVGGHTDLAIAVSSEAAQFVENKQIKVLAVASTERWPSLPNVPTLMELGYEIDLSGWWGFGAPVGVPKERLQVFYGALKKAANNSKVRATLEKMQVAAPYITGEKLKEIFQKRSEQWQPFLRALKAEQTKK